MILSGEKKEEYREFKPYWMKRFKVTAKDLGVEKGWEVIIGRHNYYDKILFKNGYSTILVECLGIRIGEGEQEWGAPYEPCFIIKLGKIIETKNCK